MLDVFQIDIIPNILVVQTLYLLNPILICELLITEKYIHQLNERPIHSRVDYPRYEGYYSALKRGGESWSTLLEKMAEQYDPELPADEG